MNSTIAECSSVKSFLSEAFGDRVCLHKIVN
jgi:hypothetical protein